MNYAGIQYDDIANGTGVRVTLFVQGCDHKCPGCQNPETWDPSQGVLFTEGTKEDILEYIESTPFVKGLTLSGGDPLFDDNVDEVFDLLKVFRSKFKDSKDIWLYTGYTWEDIDYWLRIDRNEYMYLGDKYKKRVEIIKLVDVLVDGKFDKDLKDLTLDFRGSSNQRLIDIKRSLKEKTLCLYEIKK